MVRENRVSATLLRPLHEGTCEHTPLALKLRRNGKKVFRVSKELIIGKGTSEKVGAIPVRSSDLLVPGVHREDGS